LNLLGLRVALRVAFFVAISHLGLLPLTISYELSFKNVLMHRPTTHWTLPRRVFKRLLPLREYRGATPQGDPYEPKQSHQNRNAASRTALLRADAPADQASHNANAHALLRLPVQRQMDRGVTMTRQTKDDYAYEIMQSLRDSNLVNDIEAAQISKYLVL
jgi:hypothetical protein